MTDRGETIREARWVALGSIAFALAFTWPVLAHFGEFGAAGKFCPFADR